MMKCKTPLKPKNTVQDLYLLELRVEEDEKYNEI